MKSNVVDSVVVVELCKVSLDKAMENLLVDDSVDTKSCDGVELEVIFVDLF